MHQFGDTLTAHTLTADTHTESEDIQSATEHTIFMSR